MPIVGGGATINAAAQIADGIITNNHINEAAGIVASKLATIATAGKVSGAALTALANTPSGAGLLPSANGGFGDDADFLAPLPDWGGLGSGTFSFNVNTAMHVVKIIVPRSITLNTLTFTCTSVGSAGTLDFTLYSADGQTQLFSVTTASVTGGADNDVAIGGVEIPAGDYYLAVNTNGSANLTLNMWTFNTNIRDNAATSDNPTYGKVTITASTPPATIDPDADIAADTARAVMTRWT